MAGTLEVTLIEARDLKDVDKMGKQDPYCILSVGGRTSRSNTHTDGGTAPVWNQVFTFPSVSPDQYLIIELFDENLVFRDVSIGTSKLALKEVIARGSQDATLPVFTKKGNKHKGDVLLRLVYRKGALAPTAVGVVSALGMNSGSSKKQPPKPTTGYRPGQWILPTYKDTDCWQDYESGRVLGKGTYGTTYLGMHKQTGQQVAIKVISKRRLGTPEEVEDVQREVQIMHHLKGHPSVVGLLGVYEDKSNICLVMELCSGGELFDRIVAQGKYSEKDAANVMRTIMTVVAHCHSMGVVHRDLKPENFLLADRSYTSAIKTADYGLATFFQEGQTLTDIVGSAFYIAPEVLKRCYNKEADIWSCGIILYILLSGSPPFQGAREKDIFNEVANKSLDLTSYPWTNISEPAKDCVRRMLVRDPAQRATAQEILQHDWMRENGVAPDTLLEVEVIKRIKDFSGMNKLKKEALRLIAGNLPIDEITGLREMFIEIDKDKSGTLTVDEFTTAVRNKGQVVSQAEIAKLMEAADMNGDGIIDYEEFLAAMVHVSKMQREEHLKTAFEHFDKDNSGTISRTELAQALHECKLTAKQIEQIISEVDQDGNGEIDYNEFCVMMREM